MNFSIGALLDEQTQEAERHRWDEEHFAHIGGNGGNSSSRISLSKSQPNQVLTWSGGGRSTTHCSPEIHDSDHAYSISQLML